MRKAIALAFSTMALVWAPPALPCGGGFGYGLKLDPDQNIVLRHKSGVETYFFSPHFCGLSARFGLILPVPSQLVNPPELGDASTVKQLEDLTKPEIVPQTVCAGRNDGSNGGGGGKAAGSWDAGSVQVIDKGTVGIFDYTVLKADTARAFTDWLDANQYPYDAASSTQFTAYVTSGWYFVAFKVTADSQDPPQGRQICGDLGPIKLSFPAATPVIPARIAAASSAGDAGSSYTSRLKWRVFAIAAQEMTSSTVAPTLRFSGALNNTDISGHSALKELAGEEDPIVAGERLTELDFDFYPAQISSDLLLKAATKDTDYRRTEYVTTYIQCDAGASGAGGALPPDAGTAGRGGTGRTGGATGKGGSAVGGAAGTTTTIVVSDAGGSGGDTNVNAGGASGRGGASVGGAPNKGGAGGSTESIPDPEPEPHGGCSVSPGGAAGAWAYGLGVALFGWALRHRRRKGRG